MTAKKLVSFILPLLTFAAGAAGAGAWVSAHPKAAGLTRLYFNNNNYKYIRPYYGIEVGQKKDFSEFKPLQGQLQDFIATAEQAGQATDVSVYFREIENGHWTGINENAKFSPGSLLKVPLMISYFKLAEDRPEILTSKLTKTDDVDHNAMEISKPNESIVRGQAYSVQDLIRRMIVFSDNNAAILLFEHIDNRSLNEVYGDLGLDFPEKAVASDYISSKQYALFLRVLYFSSYLKPELSDQALQYLAETDFKKGIGLGLPPGTTVAHKFGERSFRLDSGEITAYELHDCGVIYHPTRPYLLCVMTKGAKEDALPGVLNRISKMVYDEVESNFK